MRALRAIDLGLIAVVIAGVSRPAPVLAEVGATALDPAPSSSPITLEADLSPLGQLLLLLGLGLVLAGVFAVVARLLRPLRRPPGPPAGGA